MNIDQALLRLPQPVPAMPGDDEGLRPVDWSALCATLTAASDLRAVWNTVVLQRPQPGQASFAPADVGAILAASARRQDGRREINPEPSTNGKPWARMARTEAGQFEDRADCDRGLQ
ncbi:hypothetical protein ACFO0A_02975 [Novosphingobium tardum]|uniref:Uncharacterized protein n=1 Tax=Novosphingobium tardum TaxID=1538021 RepID=A0ABV8RMI3_9SPHN